MDHELGASPCLHHSFTVHTSYELAPPYPLFSPKVYLKLDGVVVINTGDSLIAISTQIEEGGKGLGLDGGREGACSKCQF